MRGSLPLVAAATVLLLAGCTSSPAAETASQDSRAGGTAGLESYVALGDSYTAGPLVPTTDLADGCFRSDGNYPSLLADRLSLDLTDVSCSGAQTGDLSAPQRTVRDATVPAQLDALGPDADLVTVGIGGNDLGLFSALVRTCLGLRGQDPAGSPCAESAVGRDLVTDVDRIGDNVAEALRRVRDRAPGARVVLVGYLRISPSEGSCPGDLPFAEGDVAFGDRVMRSLAGRLEAAAGAAGADYLNMYAASAGHDVCADRPWVNGRESVPGLASAYHPTPAGMRAVTRELVRLLRS